ncbi:hypothetical protein Aperf_G00000121538 [Anoplocephala perfoliata]
MCFIADLLLALSFAEALIVLTSCASNPPPPYFTGYDSTDDSITAQLSPIYEPNEGLTYKIFYASGGEVPADCDSSTSVCTVSNLPPATLYLVYARVCPDNPFNVEFCSEPSDAAYCATKPNRPSISSYTSTSESITWEFGAIPESNATLKYKVYDDNEKQLVECTDSSMPCMVSSLSPGTGYTVQLMVCVVVPWGYEQCSEKSEEMKCTTRPNPPSNVLVEPFSSSSVRVVLTTPEPAAGIERYTVSVDGGDSIPCDIEEDERRRSCTISGLSPGTEYRVNAVSWLGGEFSSVSSEAAQGSGWTKLSKPSSWSYESTSDSITWQFSPSTETSGSLTYKVFDESGQQVAICSSSSLPCRASNLKPATVYPVYFLVCLTVSNNGELCSEKSDEMNCVTRPDPPSFIGYDSTDDSISAQLSPIPESKEALTYKLFYASGDEVPANCDSSTSVCTVSNLPPATLYTVYSVICLDVDDKVEVCSEKSDDMYCATKPNRPSILSYTSTSESITWEFGAIPESNATLTCKVYDDSGKQLVECTDSSVPCMVSSLSPGTGYTVQLMVCVVVPYGHEQCSEKSEEMKCTTRPNPPSNVLVEPVSSSSVRVVLTTPEPAAGIERYTVSVDGGDSIPCDIEEDERRRSCTISGLSPGTEYRVNAVSWLGGEFSSVSSEAAQGSGWTKLSKPSSWSYESTSDSITWQFSPSTETSGSLTYKVFDESGQQVAICSSSSLPCRALNLKPATVYPVYFLVCLTVSNNGELCSEKSDEMNCVTRPDPPSFIGYDSTDDSISAQLSPIPESKEALTYKLFYASGDEVPANCDSSTSVCTVSNLPPATLYTVYSVICLDVDDKVEVCSEKSDDMYCATKPNRPSILSYTSTSESITWEFGAIPESNATLTCKVYDDSGKQLVECTDSSVPCMVSSLSPGTGYTVQLMVCVVVPYGHEQCSEKSEEMKCTTRPNPPSNVLVEPVSSSSVRVVLTTPEPAAGIERYTVSVDGGDSIPCDIEEDERRRSCTISGLSPGTEYRVNAVSWLGGEFSSVSSEAAQGSGWTKLSKPSSWSYESTSDSITWQFSPSTETSGSLTYKVFDESGQQVAICSSSSLPCRASNLKPATVYPVYFLVCLTVSNNGELCSEKSDEMNCVTRPDPPSFIGYDSTDDSISAQLSPIPESKEALTYKLFYASGDEVPANCDSSTSVCTVSNLPPATLYTVYSVICLDVDDKVEVCSEKSDDMYCATKPNRPSILSYTSTSESITWEFGAIPESNATLTCKVYDDSGKQLVECTDSSVPCMVSSLSPGTGYTVQLMVCVVVPYGHEQCSEKSEEMKCTTRPNPPSNVLVEPVSSSSVRVVLTTPEPAAGIERYTVSVDGGDSIPCDIEEDERRRSCTISGLSPGTEYRVNAVSWLGGEFSSVSSEAAQGSGWTKLSKPSSWSYESTSDSITWQFSPSTETSGSLTYKVFDESGQQVAICSSSSLPCRASNLKPATVYPVYFLVCLTVSNNGELCSEKSDEMNCVTRPDPPSSPTCESSTNDSITWSYKTIDNSNEDSWYKIVNENDHKLCDCDSSSLQCNGSGLSPATIYTGYLVVCFEGPNDEEVCSERSGGVDCATEPNHSEPNGSSKLALGLFSVFLTILLEFLN